MPQKSLSDRYQVIDADTHISEPEDVWTSRVSVEKWGDLVPHVIPDPDGEQEPGRGVERLWVFGGEIGRGVAGPVIAFHNEYYPSHPLTLEEAHPATYDATARLKYMDEEGLYAQVLYPNVAGFASGRFVDLKEPELMLECVRAYNDFLTDWCRADANRLIPLATMPFWDVDACVTEIDRVAKSGHKGVLWGGHTETYGLPRLQDTHWEPIWQAADDAGLAINFHIAGANEQIMRRSTPRDRPTAGPGQPPIFSGLHSTMMDNANHLAGMIFSGACARHPKLNIVLVESGVGWIPFVLELMDHQFKNYGLRRVYPDLTLLPSEYYKRQMYSCFWFERDAALRIVDLFEDNILYETDFPHSVSMAPTGTGDPDVGGHPKEYMDRTLQDLPDRTLRKILHDNAARVYHLN